MKAVPIDVMRDIAVKARNLRAEADKMRQEARDRIMVSEHLDLERAYLEELLFKWQACFPETAKDY
jgi:hypothetical protein